MKENNRRGVKRKRLRIMDLTFRIARPLQAGINRSPIPNVNPNFTRNRSVLFEKFYRGDILLDCGTQ
jgi:hypothetical protein